MLAVALQLCFFYLLVCLAICAWKLDMMYWAKEPEVNRELWGFVVVVVAIVHVVKGYVVFIAVAIGVTG
jgi:hypothetical protein